MGGIKRIKNVNGIKIFFLKTSPLLFSSANLFFLRMKSITIQNGIYSLRKGREQVYFKRYMLFFYLDASFTLRLKEIYFVRTPIKK